MLLSRRHWAAAVFGMPGALRAAAEEKQLTIAAASDLAGLGKALEAGFPEAKLTFSFASSGMLAQQIDAGAPFDVFLSANEGFVMGLVKKGRISREDVQIYATGRLALWSKSGLFHSFDDFGKVEKVTVAIANPQHAPYGMAARQALQKSGWWEKLSPNVVFAESVRQTLQFAESGNVDAIVTAWSLVYDREAYLIPAELHDPIRQVGAELRKSQNRKLARKFMEFLTSAGGKQILTEHGLFVPAYTPSLKR